MTSQTKFSSWWLIGGAISLIAGAALAQPAQKPLLNRDGGGVSPNVIMDIDDSGSMLYQHLPEDSASVGGVHAW
jgi:type IV pilus assembly protein PilY1